MVSCELVRSEHGVFCHRKHTIWLSRTEVNFSISHIFIYTFTLLSSLLVTHQDPTAYHHLSFRWPCSELTIINNNASSVAAMDKHLQMAEFRVRFSHLWLFAQKRDCTWRSGSLISMFIQFPKSLQQQINSLYHCKCKFVLGMRR